MNRVGLKDYLLNHADDNDLLDCAKAWDAANEYGQFETYGSVAESPSTRTSRAQSIRRLTGMAGTISSPIVK